MAYVGDTFETPAAPGEREDYTLDFVRDLPAADRIDDGIAPTFDLIVAPTDQCPGTDADVATRLDGAAIGTGTLAQQSFRWPDASVVLADIRYRIEATITTLQGRILTLHSYVILRAKR